MAEEKIEELTGEQLQEQLRTALESWPTYRKLHYRGAEDGKELPENLWMFCSRCEGVQRWSREILSRVATGPRPFSSNRTQGGFADVTYKCQNCPEYPSFVRYNFQWVSRRKHTDPNDRTWEFSKVGQWPPLGERVPSSLEKVLDEDDLAFYKNALRMRNYNLGIAAVAYLRRVVEKTGSTTCWTCWARPLRSTASRRKS